MKHKKTAVLLVLLIALAALTWKLSTWLTPQQLQQALQQTGGWAPVLYIGLFILLPAFFFPVAVLALAGGLPGPGPESPLCTGRGAAPGERPLSPGRRRSQGIG